ncbi:MAG: ergothioneine biosynthesis protein EgtB [Acidobacteria bacterium]|nr:MAG: ergothioneine biosynthesis protein EgtB [Acidobacteriota bacterium]
MNRDQLLQHYRQTRRTSTDLCRPLKAEDYRIQSMPDVSPPWWNLGHTTWFFAKNVLEPFTGDSAMDERLEYVLNSYYESLGPRLPRHERGLVTRPSTDEIYAFRRRVDRRMEALIGSVAEDRFERLAFLVVTGVQHEQQHQELLVTELKHILGSNPDGYREPYCRRRHDGRPAATAGTFVPFDGGLVEAGNVEGGWCWDNELPVHRVFLEGFALYDRLVTNGEYLAFVEDGGYRDPLLWLSNGWAAVEAEGWQAPLYWQRVEGRWQAWTLAGTRPLEAAEPVCHVSFYEADAYVRWRAQNDADWAGARLPTEHEWEHAARQAAVDPEAGNFLDDGAFHPQPANGHRGLRQMAGDLWEWTQSHYEPYPGYRPFDGALMEYNGKFMDNQRVLRGGSCATPRSHLRLSYRNFWPAGTRFQLTGLRPARSL